MRGLAFTLMALLAGSTPAIAPERHTISILAFGQSNMEGRFGPSTTSPAPSENTWAWDSLANKWTQATLGVWPFYPAAGMPGEAAGNLAYTFSRLLADECNTEVELVILARGGMKLEYFMPPEMLAANGWTNDGDLPPFGNSLSDELTDGPAMNALRTTGEHSFSIVLIHQGEANSLFGGDAADLYATKFATLMDDLKRRGIVAENAPIVVGKIDPSYPLAGNHSAAIDYLASTYPDVIPIEWDGIQQVGGKNHHASGIGLNELGERYFEAFMASAPEACAL